MAKKRKKTAVKRTTAKKAKKTKKTKTARQPIRTSARKLASAKASSKRAAGKKKKRARKAKPQGIVERMTSAFKAVVSGVDETEQMRVKLEQRGSDETQ